jgi:hypothetical protein
MAEHVMKKYIAKVEKTIYVVEELEILAETEKEAEELLDDYCCDEHHESVTITEVEEQEVNVDAQWIEESSVLGVDEFMEYKDGLH